ncbi:MAG: hypothetical protein OXI88_09960, partial [Gammaproteobacteria bacterium]|nr:hypothetical protein [Gammaproteobacteria bacterium]
MQLNRNIVINIAISIALMILSGLGKWAYGLLDSSDSNIAVIERKIIETKKERALLELEQERLELERQRQMLAYLSEQKMVSTPNSPSQSQAPVVQHKQSVVAGHLPADASRCTQIEVEASVQVSTANHVAGAYQSI